MFRSISIWPWFLVNLVMAQTTEVTNFQKLFMQKRIEQLAAVKNILKLDESKRKVLLDQITIKLFQEAFSKLFRIFYLSFYLQVLSTGRVDLESSGYVAGLSLSLQDPSWRRSPWSWRTPAWPATCC